MVPLRGLDDEKKIFIIHLREKHIKQKIISMCSQSHPNSKICFETYSEKHEENKLHRKYTFLWGPAGCSLLLLQFQRHNKIYVFISFAMTMRLSRSSASLSHTDFVNFWKIKIWEENLFFFKSNFLHIFCLCCVFLLTGKRLNIQKVVCDLLRKLSSRNTGLEKRLPWLVTLLHICGVIPTPQPPETPRQYRRKLCTSADFAMPSADVTAPLISPCRAPMSPSRVPLLLHWMASVWVFHDVSQSFKSVSWCFTSGSCCFTSGSWWFVSFTMYHNVLQVFNDV